MQVALSSILPQRVLDAGSWIKETWTATQKKAHNLRQKVHDIFRRVFTTMLSWSEGEKAKTPIDKQIETLRAKVSHLIEDIAEIQTALSELSAANILQTTSNTR
jgi:hypothetical protein